MRSQARKCSEVSTAWNIPCSSGGGGGGGGEGSHLCKSPKGGRSGRKGGSTLFLEKNTKIPELSPPLPPRKNVPSLN